MYIVYSPRICFMVLKDLLANRKRELGFEKVSQLYCWILIFSGLHQHIFYFQTLCTLFIDRGGTGLFIDLVGTEFFIDRGGTG